MSRQNNDKAALYAPELPWNTFNAEDLGPRIMQFVGDHEPFFRRWAETWYENFQFLYGNQNVKWSRKYGFAVDYDFLKLNSPFNLRANTNIARVIAEALSSFIFGNLPEWEVETTDSSSIKGNRYSKIGQKLLDAYMARLLMDKEFQAAAMIYVMFGQFACEIDWDANAGQLVEIPRWKKEMAPLFSTYMAPNAVTGGTIEVPTPLVDYAGRPLQEQRWAPVIDAMGRQQIDKMFTGDVGIHMLTPLEYRREIGQYGIHRSRWIERFRLMDYDEFLDKYEHVGGKTKNWRDVRPVYSDPQVYSMATRHFMRMQFTSPPSIDEGFRRAQSVFKTSLFKYKVFVIEHFDKPHPDKWPMGRRSIIANGVCTHITIPSYNTNKMDGWHPFVEAQWLSVSPNSIASGPMNDVVRKNKELNVKDSLIATAVRRNMGSQLLIKTGSGLDPQKLTGEPGLSHEVSDPYGVRWLHDDQPIPPVISRLRELDKEDVYETSGAQDALRGQPSTGASSGYQEKQREEREEKRLSPARKIFEGAAGGIGEKIICCLRTHSIKLNDHVMGYLQRAGAGEFTPQDVVAFLTKPADYGIDINVRKSSMAIKSTATEQATAQELSKGALGQHLATDAEVYDEYLKFFGLERFRGQGASHRDRATRENEVFMDMLRLGIDDEGLAQPVVLFDDDDNVHLDKHKDCFVKHYEEFRTNEQMMLQFLTHMEHHRLQFQEKQAQLMPGTSLQTAAMISEARKVATPTVQTIMMDTQVKQQQQQQSQAMQLQQAQQQNSAAPTGKTRPPQAPKLPSAPGAPPGGTINPQAPSQNTPSAASTGGMA